MIHWREECFTSKLSRASEEEEEEDSLLLQDMKRLHKRSYSTSNMHYAFRVQVYN